MLLCCTTDVSLEFPTICQHFCFVPLVSRFHWKVECLFCIFLFWKIFNGLRIVTWTSSQWCRSKFFCLRCYTRFFISNAFFLFKPQCCLTFSWVELQMLLRCCLIRISIIILKQVLYLQYLCPCLDLGPFMYRRTCAFAYFSEYVLLFLDDNLEEECK